MESAVVEAMKPYDTTVFANPSALYYEAVQVRQAIEDARTQVAEFLFTQPDTIIFTSGGTESTNLGILGIVEKLRNKKTGKLGKKMKPHIITTTIEHHAVLEPIKKLEKAGCAVTYLPVSQGGQVGVAELRKALRQETILVSVMYANNEIGAILPIADIGREILKWRKVRGTPYPYFHTDACQAAAYLDLNVEKLHVDLMSVNGSKIYGPKGIGILYKRRGVEIESLMYGGGQEFGLRPGTENVAGIVGFAKALSLVQREREKEWRRVEKLRDYFWQELQKSIGGVKLNGPQLEKTGVRRLPNNLNVTIPDIDAEALILYLDAIGVQCSSQSACSTDSDEVSHVLLASGLSTVEAKQSIRLTLGRGTTRNDIAYVLKQLPRIVTQNKAMNSVK